MNKKIMRSILKLVLCLCFVPLGVFSQERTVKAMFGPRGDQSRILVAFIEAGEVNFKMQSMIVDISPIKNNKEQPEFVVLDLTSTVRSLTTGAKQQKILQLRWNKTGEIEFRCEGKWKKQTTNAATDKIVEATKALFEIIPVNAAEPSEFKLTPAVEKKIIAVLDTLNAEDFSCLRELK